MLPDKLVIDLKQWNQDVESLTSIFENVLNYVGCSEYTDVGNDIKYTLNEITKFKSKLRKSIEEEAFKTEFDIFGNSFSRFRNYRYVELIFTDDLKFISSIRLLGTVGRRSSRRAIRYVLFNVPNIFDLNLINIAYNAKKIIREYSLSNINEKEFIVFLEKYFTPSPSLHKKPFRDPVCLLSDLNNQIDLLKQPVIFGASLDVVWSQPMTLEEMREENKKYELIEFKKEIYDRRKNTYSSVTPLSNVLRRGQNLRNSIGNNTDPLECIIFLFNKFFNKYDVCYLIQDVIKSNIKDPEAFLNSLSIKDFFKTIDGVKNSLREQIYNSFLLNQATNFLNALGQVQTFIALSNSSSVCLDVLSDSRKGMKISEILDELQKTYPNLYPDIEAKFNEFFSRTSSLQILAGLIDLAKLIDFCDFKLPAISLPTFRIRNLFADFTLDLEQFIFDLLCGILTELTMLLLDLLFNMEKFDDFFTEVFMKFSPEQPGNEEEKWQQYIYYSYNLLLQSAQLRAQGQQITDPELVSYLSSFDAAQRIRTRNRTRDNLEVCDIDSPVGVTTDSSVNIDSVIEQVKNYTYCLGRDNFSVKNIDDSKNIQSLKLIAEIKRKEQQTEINQVNLPNREQLSESLYNMITQISSVFNYRELSMLINGNYTETMAQIVRIICEINFPELTNKVDPIKYFIMIGKVLGAVPERQPNLNFRI